FSNVSDNMTMKPSYAEKSSISSTWEKIVDTLKCTVPKFRVDKRSVRDHVGILVFKHKKKLQLEEKTLGKTTDEPTELENLLDTITALEEGGEAELQEKKGTSNKKLQYDLDESDDKPKRQRRSGGDAIQYFAERAKVSDQLKEEDLEMRREHQTSTRE
ncbi:hypothetical protein P5673_032620, partial [Acropora cervicornis]